MPACASAALKKIDEEIALVKGSIDEVLRRELAANSAALQRLEDDLMRLHLRLASLETARKLQEALVSRAVCDAIEALLRCLSGKFRMVAWRPHDLLFFGGVRITIWMPYYARKCAPGKGISPHMALFGILQHMSPELSSVAAMLSAALSSFEEAATVLEKLGAKINVKTLRLVSKAFAQRARATKDSEDSSPAKEGDKLLEDGEDGAIRRIVLSTDGGRVRVRRPKRGPKAKGGRDRYHADWREPKLIIILMVNEKGRQDHAFPPIIDATMGGPDCAFALLRSYLKRLSLKQIKLSFVSDGAKWIWQRVHDLFTGLEIELTEITMLLDFYHASQHLNEMAAAKKGWQEEERKRWVKKMKKWLINGKHEEVLQDMCEMVKGTHSKTLRRELRYFQSHAERLSYKAARAIGLPIGSGAVESAIRRVINMRLKGPGIIWGEEGATEMLLLRSFFKAGRWGQLEKWAFSQQTLGA